MTRQRVKSANVTNPTLHLCLLSYMYICIYFSLSLSLSLYIYIYIDTHCVRESEKTCQRPSALVIFIGDGQV